MSEEKEKALVPVEEKTVDFYGDEIPVALVADNKIYIPLRPICEFLGVAWQAQLRKIRSDEVLSEVIRSVTLKVTEAGKRTLICLPLGFLNGWLFGISPRRVKPELKDRIVQYQRECYQVLANAFVTSPTETAVSSSTATLLQVREMGLAIARMAEEQIAFDQRLATTENRLDQAAIVVGSMNKRLTAVEQKLSPGKPVTDDQAMQISQAVKAVAMSRPDKNFGQVYNEIYRRFGVTSYKLLPANRFKEVMKWLTDYYQELTGGDDAPF